MSYSEKLKDPRWQRVRLNVFNRDGFACRDCGAKDKTLHVHHCHYAKGNPWDTSESHLLTLCQECHESRQASEDEAKEIFGWILASKTSQGLRSFLCEMSMEISGHQFSNMRVLHDMTIFDAAEYRWFEYALEHPEFRPAFESVTGKQGDWGAEE